MNLHEDRTALFRQLVDPNSIPQFFDRLAEDVVWTVEGVSPLGGTYRSRTTFMTATFDRLAPLMRDGVSLQLRHLFVDGDTVIAELVANSTTREGAQYDNHLCWVCRFASAAVGDPIVEVRAYLDSAMATWTILRNEIYERLGPGLSRSHLNEQCLHQCRTPARSRQRRSLRHRRDEQRGGLV